MSKLCNVDGIATKAVFLPLRRFDVGKVRMGVRTVSRLRNPIEGVILG